MINKACLAAGFAAIILSGCASVRLAPEASRVISSPSKPPRGCKFLGQVTGSQGNFFTGKWTSNRNLETGAQNALRNQAAKMKGNYVQLITNRASVTSNISGGRDGFSGGSEQTGVTAVGNVYRCPPRLIGE